MLKPGYWAVTFSGLIRGEIDLHRGLGKLQWAVVNDLKSPVFGRGFFNCILAVKQLLFIYG